MKLPFYESLTCKTGRACELCRSLNAGAIARAKWATIYEMPNAWPNCEPLGLPMVVDPIAPAWTCERCGGAHKTHKCPIHPDTSPAIERTKARRGGCCGKPTTA